MQISDFQYQSKAERFSLKLQLTGKPLTIVSNQLDFIPPDHRNHVVSSDYRLPVNRFVGNVDLYNNKSHIDPILQTPY